MLVQCTDVVRIRRRKAERRGQTYDPNANGSRLGFPSYDDDEDEDDGGIDEAPTQDELVDGVSLEHGVPGSLELGPELLHKFTNGVNLNDSVDGGLEKPRMVSLDGRGSLDVQVEEK